MKIIASRHVLARSSLLRRGKESGFDIRGCRWDKSHARSPTLFTGIFSHRAVDSSLSLPLTREKQVKEAHWSDLSLKGRFFQAANPVDCVRKGPPSLEFPVRRGARKLVSKTKTRGSARERGWKERGEARGRVGGLFVRERCGWARGVVKKREGDKEIRKMGESSPDLSLRLRQGSSDSRDSFYMDFAQVRGKKGRKRWGIL